MRASDSRVTIGIDPGTAILGYGIVEGDGDSRLIEFGVIETPSGQPMPDRLVTLYNAITELLVQHEPDELAVEQLFFARNVTTAIAVGQARGVVLLAAAQRGIPVTEYSPSEIKNAIVGYGKADKRQVQEMVRILLALEMAPHPDDAADALAVALCHAQTRQFAAHLHEG
ncbi:MAG: crossover junction endodeoxyribonuclease RuvC [Chloroflexia bacterium]|jgi:crossover junction endodeoxyribonuclease RuvC|nr:crossover junction endodeoxyribonuclease RuvC [Chloroflexia bacterium]MDQ3613153.1 crossover junction endodeoxyribonuclease RuvC [Chloroflexota bacterium]